MYSCSVLWKLFTSALVLAGTLDTLSALNAPRCPKASQGLTRSLWAEMVFPDVPIYLPSSTPTPMHGMESGSVRTSMLFFPLINYLL